MVVLNGGLEGVLELGIVLFFEFFWEEFLVELHVRFIVWNAEILCNFVCLDCESKVCGNEVYEFIVNWNWDV